MHKSSKFANFIQRIERERYGEQIPINYIISKLNDPKIGAYTMSLLPKIKSYPAITIAEYESIRNGELPQHPNKFLHAYARVAGIKKIVQIGKRQYKHLLMM